MATTFINDNFLLQTQLAEQLYHEHAAGLPIIDYHNHLSPELIADDHQFANITAAWLEGDHYKWRAMRANGVGEYYITGTAASRDKFVQWAKTVPATLRNPLYHWTHLELQRYFGINELLNEKNAVAIFEETQAILQQPTHSTQALLLQQNVEVVCTTDHPTDNLAHHRRHRDNDKSVLLLPTFRPDKFLVVNGVDFPKFLEELETCTGNDIITFDQLLSALEERVDYFHAIGCRLSDHGLGQLFSDNIAGADYNATLQNRRAGRTIAPGAARQFQMALLHELAKMYHKRGWTMQLHLGAIRNNNGRLLQKVGADVGCDSIGDYPQAEGLAAFMNRLDMLELLPKTILYNLNPRDNELFATMAGNYNDGSMAGKIQWGSAWWFLDQKDGMEKQINTLSNMGLLSRFLGMLTDSRSFLSFPRHEYFRRILCNLIGQDVAQGLLPDEPAMLGQLIEDICYHNANRYFTFNSVKEQVT